MIGLKIIGNFKVGFNKMIFKYYPRYASLVILIIFNVVITVFVKQSSIVAFYGLSILIVIWLFGEKYILNENVITKNFYFFMTKEIKITDIKMIEIVIVKQNGTIEIYIGKKANAVKEDGYYLTMSDGNKIKIDSGYQNKEGITLGKYLVKKYKIHHKEVEKYKLFNDRL